MILNIGCPTKSGILPLPNAPPVSTLINLLVVHLPSDTFNIFSLGKSILGCSFNNNLKNNSCPFLVPLQDINHEHF